jgi:hypothetical protein
VTTVPSHHPRRREATELSGTVIESGRPATASPSLPSLYKLQEYTSD